MGLFFTSLAILASVIAKTPTVAALLGFAGFALFSMLNISEVLMKFNPAGAAALVNNILYGLSTPQTDFLCLASTIAGTVLVFLLSFVIFKKQEI